MASARQRHLAPYFVIIICLNTRILALDLSSQFHDSGFHDLDHHMIGTDFSIKNNVSYGGDQRATREVCEDNFGLCSSWFLRDLCENDNCTFVMDNCPASCGTCTPDDVCVDDHGLLCRIFELIDTDKTFCTNPQTSVIAESCKKTCGIGEACEGTTDATPSANTTTEFIEQFEKVKDKASVIFNNLLTHLSEVRRMERQNLANDSNDCENERLFELLLENLQNFCDLKYNIFSTDESKLDDFSNEFIQTLFLNNDKQIPAIETIMRCASEIKVNAEEEIFLLGKLDTIGPEIDTISDIFKKLSDIEAVLTNLKGLKLEEDLEIDPDIVFSEIIKFSDDLHRERELAITDVLHSLLDRYYIEVSNLIVSSQNGEIISVNGLSQSILSVKRAKNSLNFAKTELTERELTGSEFLKKRKISGALKEAAALALRITDFNSTDSFNTSILEMVIDKLSQIHSLDFNTEIKLEYINRIEAEIISLIEEGKKVSTLNILDSAIVDHFLILQSDIDDHKDEVLISLKSETELKASYLIKQIRITMEHIEHKIGNSATMVDDANDEVTEVGQILTEAINASAFTQQLLDNLNKALTLCNSILDNTIVGRKFNGFDNIFSLAIEFEIEMKLLEVNARERKDTISIYNDLAYRTNLINQIIEKIKSVNGSIEPSSEQKEVINGMIDHLKTIMLVPGGGDIVDLQLKYDELFLDDDIAITGLEILSHKASSILLLLKEMYFYYLDTKNAVIQIGKYEKARSLLTQSLSIIENHETEINILVAVNDIRVKNLLFEINNIQYEEITAEQLVKIMHLNSDLKDADSFSGLQDVRYQLSEIIEFIDQSLFEYEEDKKEKQRLSSHSLVLNLLQESYQYLHELSKRPMDFPEKTSHEVESLMIEITNTYRNIHAIKFSFLIDLQEAFENLKIFFEENHKNRVTNIALNTENVKEMIKVLQKVLRVKNKDAERYGIIKRASKLVSSIMISLESLIKTEGTVVKHDYVVIDNYQRLFSTFLVEDYILSERTIQILLEYKKNIEYLKIDTISLIEISNVEKAIMNTDSVFKYIEQKLFVESRIHESFSTFSRGKAALDVTEKILISLKKMRKSVNIDLTLEISSIIQPLLNINDDITVITDKTISNTLLNVLKSLYKIEDMEAKPVSINQIIIEVQNVKENIEFYVTNLEEEYRLLYFDQIISLLTIQVQSISMQFDNLVDTMANSTKLAGHKRTEFQKLFNILEKWDENVLEIDFISILNAKEEWYKVFEFITYHLEDVNVNFGGLLDVYVLFKQFTLKVTKLEKIKIETNILQKEVEKSQEKILFFENILIDIENTLSSIDLKTITNFEIDKDISNIISVFENMDFEVSLDDLNILKKDIFSLGIPANAAGMFQLKNIVSETLTKFNNEDLWKGKTKVLQINYAILSRGLTIIRNLEEKIHILPEITDHSSNIEVQLPIKEKISMFLRNFAINSVSRSDVETLNIILNDLLKFIGTLDLNVKVTNIDDVLISLQSIKTNIITKLLETKSFLEKVLMMRGLLSFSSIILELDTLKQNIVNGIFMPGDTFVFSTAKDEFETTMQNIGDGNIMPEDLDPILTISTLTSIIDEVIIRKNINYNQIVSFTSMVSELKWITFTDDVIDFFENSTLHIQVMNELIHDKILGLKTYIDNAIKLNDMNLFESLLHSITNTIKDISTEIGFVASTTEQTIIKDVTFLINFLDTVSNTVIDDILLQDLRFKMAFFSSLEFFKGKGIKDLNELNILTSLKTIEINEAKKVFENSIKFEDQILIFDEGLDIVDSLLLTTKGILESNLETTGSNETTTEIDSLLLTLSNKVSFTEFDIRNLMGIQLKLNIINSYEYVPELYVNIQAYLTIIQDKMMELKDEISLKKVTLLKAQELFRSKRFLHNLLQKVLMISSIKPLMIIESTENEFVNKLVSKLTLWSSSVFGITQESIGTLNREFYILDILAKGDNIIKSILTLKELVTSVENSISLEIGMIIKQIDIAQEIFVKTQIQEKLELLLQSLNDFILESPILMIGEQAPYVTIVGAINTIFTSTENKEIIKVFSVHFNSIYQLISVHNNDLDLMKDALKLIDELINEVNADITKGSFQLDTMYLSFTQKKMDVLLNEILEIFKGLKIKYNTGLTIYTETAIFREAHDFILNLDIYLITDDIILELSGMILELNQIINTIPAGSIINGLDIILESIVTKTQIIQVEIEKSIQRYSSNSNLGILREIAIVLNRIVDDCVNDPLDPIYLDLDKTDFHPVLNEYYDLTESITKYNIETLFLFLDFERNLKLVLMEKKDIIGLHNFKLDIKKQISSIERLIANEIKNIDKNLETLVATEVLKSVNGFTKLLPFPLEPYRQLPIHSSRLKNRILGNISAEIDIEDLLSDIDVESLTSETIVKMNKILKQINITTVNNTQILNTDLSLFTERFFILRKNLKGTIVFENELKIGDFKTKSLESSKESINAASKILATINKDKKVISCLGNELTNFKNHLKTVSQTSAIIKEKLHQISNTASQNSKSLTITSKSKEIGSAFSKFRSFIQGGLKNNSTVITPQERYSLLSGNRKKERFLPSLPPVIDIGKIAGAAKDIVKGAAKGAINEASKLASAVDEFILSPAAETLFGNKGVIPSIISLFDDAISIIEESNIFQQGIVATRDFVAIIQDASNILFDLKYKIANLEGINVTLHTFGIIKDIERITNLWSKGISFVTLEDVKKCQSYKIELQNVQGHGDIVFDFSAIFNLVDGITTSVTNNLITQSLFTHTYEISEFFQANSVKKAFGDALKRIIQRSKKFDVANRCVGLLDTSLNIFNDLEEIIDGNIAENNDDNDEAVNLINNIVELVRTMSIDIDNLDIRDILDLGKLLGNLEPFTNVTNTGVLHFDPNKFIDIKNFFQKIRLSINETTQNIADFIETSQEVLIQKRASTEIEIVTSTFKNWINIIGNTKNHIAKKIDDTNQEIFNAIINFITEWGLNSRHITENDIFEFETLFKRVRFLELVPGQVIKGFNILKVHLLDAPISLLHQIQSGGPLSSNTYLASDKLYLSKFTNAKEALDNLLAQSLDLSDLLTEGADIDTDYNESLKNLIESALRTSEKWAAGLIENFHIKGFKQMEKKLNFLSTNLKDVSSDIITLLQSLIGSLENTKIKIDTYIVDINLQIAETNIDVNLDDAFNAFSHIMHFIDDLTLMTDAYSAQAISIPNFDNVVNTLMDLSTDFLNKNLNMVDLNQLKDAWKGSIEELINISIEPGFRIENLVEIKKFIHIYQFSLANDIIQNKFNKIKSIAETFSFKTLCHLLNNCANDKILSIDRDITDLFKYVSQIEKDIYNIGIDQIRMISSMGGMLSFSVAKLGENILYLGDITEMLAYSRIQLHKFKIAQNFHFEWRRDSEILSDAKDEISQIVNSLKDIQFNIGAVNLDNILDENENITMIFTQLLNFTSDSISKPLFLKEILKDFDFKSTPFTPEVGILHLNEVIQLLSQLRRKQEVSDSLLNDFDLMDSILKAKSVTSKLLETLIDFRIAFKDDTKDVNANIENNILPNLLLIINPLADIQERITENDLEDLRLGAEAYFGLTIDRIAEIKDIVQLIFKLSHVSSHLKTMSDSLEISIQSKFEYDKLNEVLELKMILNSFIGQKGSSDITTIISELEELLDNWIHKIKYETVDRFRHLVYQLGSAISEDGDILIDSAKITTHLPKLEKQIFAKLHITLLVNANSMKIKELRKASSNSILIDTHETFGLVYHRVKNIQIVENHLQELLSSLNNLTEYETTEGGLSFENSSTLLEINDLLVSFDREITFTFGVEELLVDIINSITEELAETPVNSNILNNLIQGVTNIINFHNEHQEIHVNYINALTKLLEYENAGFVIKEFKDKLDNIRKNINKEGQLNTNMTSNDKDIEVYQQISTNIIDIAFGFIQIPENNILDLISNLQKLYNYRFVTGEKINSISLWENFLFDSEDSLTDIIEKFYYQPSFRLAVINKNIGKFSYTSGILNRYLYLIEKIDQITEITDVDDEENVLLFDFDVPQRIFGLFKLSLQTLQNWEVLLDVKEFELEVMEKYLSNIGNLIRTLKINPFNEENEITSAFIKVKNNIINTITNHLSKIEVAVNELSDFAEEKEKEAHILEKLSNIKQLNKIAMFIKGKLDCEINSTDIDYICNLTVNAENITNLLDGEDFIEAYEGNHYMILTFVKSIGFFFDEIESSCEQPENLSSESRASNLRHDEDEDHCITDLMTSLDSISEKCVNIIEDLEKTLDDFESVDISAYVNLEEFV